MAKIMVVSRNIVTYTGVIIYLDSQAFSHLITYKRHFILRHFIPLNLVGRMIIPTLSEN